MSWVKGEVRKFPGNNPQHKRLRKIRTSPNQPFNEMYFLHLNQAREAGYPEEALNEGREIWFKPTMGPKGPAAELKPYEAAPGERVAPTEAFHNPYHFVPLAPPAACARRAGEGVLGGTLHDRFGLGDGAERRFSGRVVCRLTTEGPMVVGAAQKRRDGDDQKETLVEPFELPHTKADGTPSLRPAIPGSTLRGLIASLVEAVSCSTLRVLEEKEYKEVRGTLHDGVSLVSEDFVPMHSSRVHLTLAERLFGFVEKDGKRALAGRVRFSHALAEEGPFENDWYENSELLKVLASPKPPCPALYFGHLKGVRKPENWSPREIKLDLKKHSPQGRKVYLHHREDDLEFATCHPGDDKLHLKLRVEPVKKGIEFVFHIDFDNLQSEELEYLVYALRPVRQFRHKLGLGKPLGLGTVRIEPLRLCFLDRSNLRYRPGGLFGPKYEASFCPGFSKGWAVRLPELVARYRSEASEFEPRPSSEFPNWETLHDAARRRIPPKVRFAVENSGDPEKVIAPVQYPLTTHQIEAGRSEGEHFRWFVANKDSNTRQRLKEIEPAGGALPLLRRHSGR